MFPSMKKKWTQIKELSGFDAFSNLVLIFIAVSIVLLLVAHQNKFYDDPGWINDVLVEAHGMWFDILILGILAAVLGLGTEKKQNIQRYSEEIEDFLAWESDESAYRIAGSIRRLNRLGTVPKSLYGVNLSDIDLNGVNLSGVDLSESKLIDTKLCGAILKDADLSGADLTDAFLIGADLSGANLSDVRANGAKLRGARLDQANLSDSNFSRAEITGASLLFANLSNALFFRADFTGADLRKADLSCANFSRATITESQIELSKLCQTRFPKSFSMDSNRDCIS